MDAISEIITGITDSGILPYLGVGASLIIAVEFFWWVTDNGSTAQRRQDRRLARRLRQQKDRTPRP